MAKYGAYGTILERGAVTIAGVTSISGPGLSLDTEDVTTHDSTAAWEEVVGTILRSGEISMDIVYDPAAATHKNAAGGILADLVARTAQAYSLIFTDTANTEYTFNAFVVGFEPDMPVDGALTASVSMKITGKPTIA